MTDDTSGNTEISQTFQGKYVVSFLICPPTMLQKCLKHLQREAPTVDAALTIASKLGNYHSTKSDAKEN